MGTGFYEPNFLKSHMVDYDKLFEIKDFLLLMKVIEYLENKILEKEGEEITIFDLGTYVYTKEDLKKIGVKI